MPHDSSVPPARLETGRREGGDLYGTPRVGQVPVPGTAAVILGYTIDGQAVILATTRLEWLIALETAAREAAAQGIVEAGMTLAARS